MAALGFLIALISIIALIVIFPWLLIILAIPFGIMLFIAGLSNKKP